MVDFHKAAVRFGKPGKLYAAPVGTVEPADHVAAWGAGWVCLGYTVEGSTISYEITVEKVEVAEELDPIAQVTTGRNATVEVALAEVTNSNLSVVFNGGQVTGDDGDWVLEPPDLGSEEAIALGWDAYPIVADNDLRFIFRQCMQGGSVSISNRKGTELAALSANFQLMKPDSGDPLFIVMGAGELNPAP